jgi:UDPglucose 6-dehydrogenase
MNKRIGIIGNGFVGNAIHQGMKNEYPNIMVHDKNPELSKYSFEDVISQCQYIFVCVNTPMTKEGECYTGIIEEVVQKIHREKPMCEDRTIILKSTVPPGTTENFQEIYNSLKFVFNPEFLTEANSVQDFKEQDRIILGTKYKSAFDDVAALYRAVFPQTPILFVASKEAEMVKYVSNTFLSTKVIYANEINRLCKHLEIDYDTVISAAKYDKRLGDSHWNVPGPDGDYGFGGHCFPKDLNALIFKAEHSGASVPLLKLVRSINDDVRTDRNWEKLKGRAVI